jgi:hypothetical protein
MQALPVGTGARQFGGVSARYQQHQCGYAQNAFHALPLVTLWADRAMFLLLLENRRHQVQNQGHRTSGIDVHRPYLCQRHHRHCRLDKF